MVFFTQFCLLISIVLNGINLSFHPISKAKLGTESNLTSYENWLLAISPTLLVRPDSTFKITTPKMISYSYL